MTCPASFTQRSFWGRNDDGDETTATWKGLQDSNFTQAVDTNFRIRFDIQEGAGCGGNNKVWRLQYNLAGAGWVDCSATSLVVRASDSALVTDAVATTDQLAGGTGTFQGGASPTGGFDDVNCNAGGASMDVAASGHSEAEFCVQIRSADVTNGQTLQLRVTDAGTALASYTSTPTITVSEPQQYSMTAEAGSFNLTGSSVNLLYKKLVSAAAGSYTLTGYDATLSKVRNYILTADPGSYSLTGSDVTLLDKRLVGANAGSYTLTGSDASLEFNRIVTASAGSYNLTGSDAGLYFKRAVSAVAGSYSLTGSSANLYLSRVLSADAGAFNLTGSDVTLTYTPVAGAFTLDAEPGAFNLTGSDANLVYTPLVVVETAVQRGGSSKRRKRPRPRYWWEEEEEQETVLTPEVIAELPPVIEPSIEMPRIRFPAEPERPQVNLAPMMRAMRKRAKMKLAAMIAMDMLDE